MKKHITKYYESDGLVTCTFEILDIETDELIDRLLSRIRRDYKEKWIAMLLVKGRNIKCKLWVSGNKNSYMEINNFKTTAINDLIDRDFIFADETIRGDGSV